ncbi:hypothetical protein K8I28_12220 [bacterium]|nr:hypothetical protein [bacterium]
MKQSKRTQKSALIFASLLVCVLLIAIGCSLENPGLPQWDLPVFMPFSLQQYSINELITDSTTYSEDGYGVLMDSSSGELNFMYEQDIPGIKLDGTQLEIGINSEESFVVNIDTIVVDSMETLAESLFVSSIFPDLVLPGTYDIPAFEIPDAAGNLPHVHYDSLEVIHVVQNHGGGLRYNFINDSELNWDSLRITFSNVIPEPGEESFIASDIIRSMNPRSTTEGFLDMSGKVIHDSLQINLEGWGPEQSNVNLTDSDRLKIEFWVDSLKASYVEAVLKKQPAEEIVYGFEFTEGHWIQEATVSEGIVRLVVESTLDVEDSVYLFIPALHNQESGEILHREFRIERAEDADNPWKYEEDISLENYRLAMDLPNPPSDTAIQSMNIHIRSIVLSSGREPDGVTPRVSALSISDSVSATVILDTLVLDRLIGVADSLSFEIEPIDHALDIYSSQPSLQENLADQIQLEDVDIFINLANTIEYPALLELKLIASNSSLDSPGNRDSLIIEEWISPNQSNLVIEDVGYLISLLPDTIRLEGIISIGRNIENGNQPFDPFQPHEIQVGDSLSGKLELISPIRLAIVDSVLISPEVERLEEPLSVELHSFKLSSHITNSIPIGGRLHLLAGQFPDDQTAIDELVIANADLYRITDAIALYRAHIEYNSDTTYIESTLLDSDVLELFTRENVYIRQIVRLMPTEGVVQVLPDDFLEVTVTAELEYRVGSNVGNP